MRQPQIDELDKQLIDILAKDARISNRKIASELGVTEGTVRGRIRRLQKDRLIAFTAITSFEMADNTRMAIIGVQVDPAQVQEISRKISDISTINAVMVTMGRFNIMAFCLFSELDQLHEISSDKILAMNGVHHVETSIAVRTLKYNARIVHIGDEV
ncbi:MAG: Lrp/AsnC family transcriptional regulator [Pontixanthobacter sp.]